MQAPEVTVAPAIDRDVADWDEFTGHFEAVKAVDVRPRVSGFIQRVCLPRRRDRQAGRRRWSRSIRGRTKPTSRAPRRSLEQAKTHEQLAQQELERAKRS